MLTFLLQIEVKQLELIKKSCLTLKYWFISTKAWICRQCCSLLRTLLSSPFEVWFSRAPASANQTLILGVIVPGIFRVHWFDLLTGHISVWPFYRAPFCLTLIFTGHISIWPFYRAPFNLTFLLGTFLFDLLAGQISV